MSKQHVRVFVRTRPTANAFEGLQLQTDGESIVVNLNRQPAAGRGGLTESIAFRFDGVLANASQDAVYARCAADAVEAIMAGVNATLFCYGQTGAGKTHTMSGDVRSFAQRGLIARALGHVFREADARVDRVHRIQVSYLEVCNEALSDLLADDPASTADALAIVDDASGTHVRGLSLVEVHSEAEALAAFFRGEAARTTAVHVLNASSSRSHAIFTVHVEARVAAEADERAVVSKLHLVDLAGSERIKKTGATGPHTAGASAAGQGVREAAVINRSLAFLEQVVNSLARRDAHVPFRQTKLTALLRDALGGNSRTVMIANLWPEAAHMEETMSTLRFAQRVGTLVTEPVINESTDPALLLRRAERQVRELKQELAMRDMLSGRGRVVYDDLSEAELRELAALVGRYLEGNAEVEELPTDSLRRIRETYRALRAIVTTTLATNNGGSHSRGVGSFPGTGQGEAGAPAEEGLVGEVDASGRQGFHVGGQAPTSARPEPGALAPAGVGARGPGSVTIKAPFVAARSSTAGSSRLELRLASPLVAASRPASVQGPVDFAFAASADSLGGPAAFDSAGPGVSGAQAAAFQQYKSSHPAGLVLHAELQQRQGELQQLMKHVKAASVQLNAAKHRIDEANAQASATPEGQQLNPLAAERSAAGNALATSASRPGVELKDAKARYRDCRAQLEVLRGDIGPLTEAVTTAKAALITAFEKHWVALRADGGPGRAATSASQGHAPTGSALMSAADPGEAGDDAGDPGEVYERAQMARIMATEPESASFYAARRLAGGRARK